MPSEQLVILFDAGWTKQVRAPYPPPDTLDYYGEKYIASGRSNGMLLYKKESAIYMTDSKTLNAKSDV